jgi:hypothetical protein
MDVDTTMKIDLSMGSRDEWNKALDNCNERCILDGRWYSDEVDKDDEVSCYPAVEDSEEEEEEDIAFHCFTCEIPIVRNSEEHDHSGCLEHDEDKWYCGNCYGFALRQFEEEEEEEEED